MSRSTMIILKNKEISPGKLALFFSAPALFVLTVTVLIPIIYAVYLSLYRYKLKRAKKPFVGLQNYEKILTDEKFWDSLTTSLIFAVSVVGVIITVSFFLALLLDQDFPGRGWLRALLLIPWAIPDVVNALLWKWLLHPTFGVMNALFSMGGLIDEYVAWLSSMPSAMIWVVIAYSWKNIPLATLLILAGLQTVSKTLHEAAMVEGASAWQRTLNITLPLLRPTLTVVLIFETIFALKVFDLIYVLTSGGPGRSTAVLGWNIYINTFKKLDFGSGSALAMILGLITLFLAIFFYSFLDRGERQ